MEDSIINKFPVRPEHVHPSGGVWGAVVLKTRFQFIYVICLDGYFNPCGALTPLAFLKLVLCLLENTYPTAIE